MKKPQILAPVGYFDSLQAAVLTKADCIYFGIKQLNMRSLGSNNFTIEDLKEISSICKKNNIKSYLTLNSIIYDGDISLMKQIVDAAKKNNISAIIAHDMATIGYALEKDVKVHISTQANISNIEAIKFYSKFSDVMVLARELTLDQITNIIKQIEAQNITGPSNELVKIEVFIHGALCVSISGKCYMSLAQYNKSANRGACLQACRRKYRVFEEDTNKELVIDNKYIMSPKDLCTIGQIDKLIKAGVSIFKIEGRARSCEYVHRVVTCYSEAIASVIDNSFNQDKIDKWIDRLKAVYNRGFWHGGYYLGEDSEMWTNSYGSKACKTKTYIGKATNYFSKINVAEFLLHSHSIKQNDQILITGPTTGVVETQAISIKSDKGLNYANKGEKVAIAVNQKIRKNDKLYLIKDKNGS